MPNPSELTYFAVAKPMTFPVRSNTGPPEFPGLIAAFVVPKKVPLLTLETIPIVRIPGNPSGLPITPTHQPCCGVVQRQFNGGRDVEVSIPATSFASSQA